MQKRREWYYHLGVKIPKTLMEAIDRYLTYEPYASKSEFARHAMQDYIGRKAPGLIEEVIAEKRKKANQNE